MKRRTAVKGLMGISIGAIALHGCSTEALSQFNNFSLSSREYRSLTELSDTILPLDATLTNSAEKPVDFLLRMVDVCESPESRESFTKGIKEFSSSFLRSIGSTPSEMSAEEKRVLLTSLEEDDELDSDLRTFYSMTKKYTIQHFTSSEYFLTNIMEFEFVPGRFIGCRPI